MRGKARTTWKVRPMPRRQTRCGFRPEQLGAGKPDAASIGGQETVDHVEERGLAGAVWPDDAVDCPLGHGQADPVDGLETAEGAHDAIELQQGFAPQAARGHSGVRACIDDTSTRRWRRYGDGGCRPAHRKAISDAPIDAVRRQENNGDDGDAVDHPLDARDDVTELGVQRLGQRHEHGGADHRPPVDANAAEQRDNERLSGNEHPEHALRRDDQLDDGIEAADCRGHRRAQHDGQHLPEERVDASRLGGRLVLLDGEQRPAEARALDVQRHDHADNRQRQRQRDIHTLVVELGVKRGRLAHHRQGHFLVAQPLEHVEHGQGVGQHGQREVVAAQTGRSARR